MFCQRLYAGQLFIDWIALSALWKARLYFFCQSADTCFFLLIFFFIFHFPTILFLCTFRYLQHNKLKEVSNGMFKDLMNLKVLWVNFDIIVSTNPMERDIVWLYCCICYMVVLFIKHKDVVYYMFWIFYLNEL